MSDNVTLCNSKEGETMKYTVFKGKAKDFKGFTGWMLRSAQITKPA